jgi:hypothetical protein
VEGIACYFESLRWQPTYAILGGWDAPRLQTARYRWLQQGHRRELQDMTSVKQAELVAMKDLAAWYTDATAYVHWFLDGSEDEREQALLRHIDSVYRRGSDPQWEFSVGSDELIRFLHVTNEQLEALHDTVIRVGTELVEPSIKEICLGGCPITESALRLIPRLPNVEWFDAAGLPLSDSILERVLGNSCQRLNLERTRVTDGIGKVLTRQSNLSELDLSSTRCGDATVAALIPGTKLKTLWLTGSQVSDQSIESLGTFGNLRQLDLQKTQVTETGLDRLRQRQPSVEINPLVIQNSFR